MRTQPEACASLLSLCVAAACNSQAPAEDDPTSADSVAGSGPSSDLPGSSCAPDVQVGSNCFRHVALNVESSLPMLVDLENDGREDLLAIRGSELTLVRFGADGSHTIATTTTSNGEITFGDFDNDGVKEIIVSSTDLEMYALADDGFVLASTTAATLGPVGAIQSPDLGDILIGTVPMIQGHGFDGSAWTSFGSGHAPPGCGINESAILGDFNGDGLGDAVFFGVVGTCDSFPDGAAQPPFVFISSSDGDLAAVEFASEPDMVVGAAGDLDGNGADDLILLGATVSSSPIIVWGGEDPFTSTAAALPAGAVFEGLGDLLGEGVDSVIFTIGTGDMASLWHRSGGVGAPVELAALAGDRFGDFNGDQIDDIFYREGLMHHVYLSRGPL